MSFRVKFLKDVGVVGVFWDHVTLGHDTDASVFGLDIFNDLDDLLISEIFVGRKHHERDHVVLTYVLLNHRGRGVVNVVFANMCNSGQIDQRHDGAILSRVLNVNRFVSNARGLHCYDVFSNLGWVMDNLGVATTWEVCIQ